MTDPTPAILALLAFALLGAFVVLPWLDAWDRP